MAQIHFALYRRGPVCGAGLDGSSSEQDFVKVTCIDCRQLTRAALYETASLSKVQELRQFALIEANKLWQGRTPESGYPSHALVDAADLIFEFVQLGKNSSRIETDE